MVAKPPVSVNGAVVWPDIASEPAAPLVNEYAAVSGACNVRTPQATGIAADMGPRAALRSHLSVAFGKLLELIQHTLGRVLQESVLADLAHMVVGDVCAEIAERTTLE